MRTLTDQERDLVRAAIASTDIETAVTKKVVLIETEEDRARLLAVYGGMSHAVVEVASLPCMLLSWRYYPPTGPPQNVTVLVSEAADPVVTCG